MTNVKLLKVLLGQIAENEFIFLMKTKMYNNFKCY